MRAQRRGELGDADPRHERRQATSSSPPAPRRSSATTRRRGRELWRSKGLESNAVPSPVAGDGVVVLSAGYPAKIAMRDAAGGTGDVTERRVLWTLRQGHGVRAVADPGTATTSTSSPTRGSSPASTRKTGEVKYEGGRPPVGRDLHGLAGGVRGQDLLMSSMDGDTIVLKAGPPHEVLRTNPLGEPIAASPAVAGGRLYIRGEHHLFAIGTP